MFQGNNIIGNFEKKNLNQQVCSLSRAVTVCMYMNHKKIRERMVKTIDRIEEVLCG